MRKSVCHIEKKRSFCFTFFFNPVQPFFREAVMDIYVSLCGIVGVMLLFLIPPDPVWIVAMCTALI